jgi:hypothetical protein
MKTFHNLKKKIAGAVLTAITIDAYITRLKRQSFRNNNK